MTKPEDRCSGSLFLNGVHLWASDKFPKVCKKCGKADRPTEDNKK